MLAHAERLQEEGRFEEALDLVLNHIAPLTKQICDQDLGQHGSKGPQQKLGQAVLLGCGLCNRLAEHYLKAKVPQQAAAALARETQLLEILNSFGKHESKLDEVRIRYEHAFNLAEVARGTGELEESLLWLGACTNFADTWGLHCCPDVESAHICLAETLLQLDRLEAAEQSSASAILVLADIPDLCRLPMKAYSMCFALSLRQTILAGLGWWQESGACVVRAKEVAAEVGIECGLSEAKAHRALVTKMERAHAESVESNRVESACQAGILAGIVRTELNSLLEGRDRTRGASPEIYGRFPRSPSKHESAPSGKPRQMNQCRSNTLDSHRPKSPVRASDRYLECIRPVRRRHYWAMRDGTQEDTYEYYKGHSDSNAPRLLRREVIPPEEHVNYRAAGPPDDQVKSIAEHDDVIADFLDSLH
eukprot:gnl/MRDRNA2_/MRDRNA2_96051_c0_seq1.p1 gnl/MRDRNA2_/MRDRNA2_96051_c0~~gnl/MRDRNA2_/MRDRNA2_96051_c0_seq1.p1  ORF type:complete len:421 (+),score=75.20 gnl/MRDRNA2_/MRDRNA2_96051_c0_seq1:96-1358(+)